MVSFCGLTKSFTAVFSGFWQKSKVICGSWVAVIMIGNILTLLRSSAASSFFWMSSREMSLFGGLVTQWATSDTGEGGFRMTSKAWPEARLLMGLMSMSACEEQTKSPTVSLFHAEDEQLIFCLIPTYLRSRP